MKNKKMLNELQLKKIIKRTILNEGTPKRLKKRVSGTGKINEQQGTPWCSYCVSSAGSMNACPQCNSSFNKDNITCQACKNLFPGTGAYPQGLVNTHCNQVGQPCHTTQTQWSGGKGEARAATIDDMQARKSPAGKGGRKIKVTESELISTIEKIVNEQMLVPPTSPMVGGEQSAGMGDLTNHLTKEILMEYCEHSHRNGCPRACETDKPVLKALHEWCKTGMGQRI